MGKFLKTLPIMVFNIWVNILPMPPPQWEKKKPMNPPLLHPPHKRKRNPQLQQTHMKKGRRSSIKNWLSKDQLGLESYQDIDEITDKILTNTG